PAATPSAVGTVPASFSPAQRGPPGRHAKRGEGEENTRNYRQAPRARSLIVATGGKKRITQRNRGPRRHGERTQRKAMTRTYFLALETSCDETAAAVFTDELDVLANVVASQTELHARFGGVVPEVAARAHLQQLLPVIDEALRTAGVRLAQIGGGTVHPPPPLVMPAGLVGALLVGVSAAKMLALALDVPLLAVNHIEAHIYACRLAAGRDIFPCVGLVVSGGHTTLFHCRSALQFERLGATRDDAAGEAFDKV